MIQVKLCLLGDVSVGKTSLVRRFVDRAFSETYLCTVGVTISRKRAQVSSGPGSNPIDLELVLWDLEGGTPFTGVVPSYLRGARAAVVVGDVTRLNTLDPLDEYIGRFQAVNAEGLVTVALNKMDLTEPGALAAVLPGRWHDEGITVHRTSARTGEGVDDLFLDLGTRLIRDRQNGPLR